MSDAIKLPYGNTKHISVVQNNADKLVINLTSLGNHQYPRLFIVETAVWNTSDSVKGALGLVKVAGPTECGAAILANPDGIVTSASIDGDTKLLTVNLSASRSYCRLTVFDC